MTYTCADGYVVSGQTPAANTFNKACTASGGSASWVGAGTCVRKLLLSRIVKEEQNKNAIILHLYGCDRHKIW